MRNYDFSDVIISSRPLKRRQGSVLYLITYQHFLSYTRGRELIIPLRSPLFFRAIIIILTHPLSHLKYCCMVSDQGHMFFTSLGNLFVTSGAEWYIILDDTANELKDASLVMTP